MPLGVEKRKFAEYVEYVFLILGLLGFLLLAIFLFEWDALSQIGLNAYDLFITSVFDLVVASAIYAALDKVNLSDFEFSIFLVLIAFLDLILFHNVVSVLLAILLFVAAMTEYFTFLFFKKFFYFLAILLQIIFYFLSISFHKSGTILFVYTAGFFILNY